MKKFKRKGQLISSHLSDYEVHLLESLVHQLQEMISDGMPDQPLATAEAAEDDPFAFWGQDLELDPDEPEVPDDPVLKRLFPTAYPHDAAASSDFRRYTEPELRRRKLTDADQVLGQLAATQGGAYPLQIPVDQVDPWLKTLTSLRISVATRLGITDAESTDELAQVPDDDPRAFMLSVYDWLGFAQETLLTSL